MYCFADAGSPAPTCHTRSSAQFGPTATEIFVLKSREIMLETAEPTASVSTCQLERQQGAPSLQKASHATSKQITITTICRCREVGPPNHAALRQVHLVGRIVEAAMRRRDPCPRQAEGRGNLHSVTRRRVMTFGCQSKRSANEDQQVSWPREADFLPAVETVRLDEEP